MRTWVVARQARTQGTGPMVGLDSDAPVRGITSPGRSLVAAGGRAAALGCVAA
jgi:hypothetical protein